MSMVYVFSDDKGYRWIHKTDAPTGEEVVVETSETKEGELPKVAA